MYRLLAEKYNMEIPRSQVLPAERQKACHNLLRDYFASLCKHLEKDHAELKNMEKQNRKILQVSSSHYYLCIFVCTHIYGCLHGLAVVCWTTDSYHLSSNLGVSIYEGCFIFDFVSLPLAVTRPI